MRAFGGNILFSATDLMRFMGCAHATQLDLLRMRGEVPEPGQDTEDAALLQKQGDAHEAAHLAKLKASGRHVIEIDRGDLAANAEETRVALATGAEVVFQGAFLAGNWGGWSDFLERVERPSALGPFSYEVADTKLKRQPHPKHVLQLVLYSDLLTEIQGVAPEFAHVELGTGERATLRLADYAPAEPPAVAWSKSGDKVSCLNGSHLLDGRSRNDLPIVGLSTIQNHSIESSHVAGCRE